MFLQGNKYQHLGRLLSLLQSSEDSLNMLLSEIENKLLISTENKLQLIYIQNPKTNTSNHN